MSKEIEAKFLHVNRNDIVDRIKKMGGVLQHENIALYRVVYNLPGNKIGFVRLRSNNKKVELTVKIFKNKDDKFPMEYEIIINDSFEKSKILLDQLFELKAYQE